MKRRRRHLGFALGSQLLAIFLAATLVRQSLADPGDVFTSDVPIVSGAAAPKVSIVEDGDATVSPQTGALRYSYPITVAPGRLGVEPRLALSYTSQGNMYGGVAAGWTLDIPSIQADLSEGLAGRTSSGAARYFTSTMAGNNRLIEVTEPADTDVLHTFRAQDDGTYTRYEQLTGNRWRARTTDGNVFVFGETANMVGGNHAAYAPLTHMKDAFGNRVDYFWRVVLTNSAKDWLLDRIEYTSNPDAGLTAFARVKFEYDAPTFCPGARAPVGARLKFLAGGSGQSQWDGSHALKAVQLEVRDDGNFEPRRRLELAYDPFATCGNGIGFRLLKSITERAWSPTGVQDIKPPVTFDYGYLGHGMPELRTFSVADTVQINEFNLGYGDRSNAASVSKMSLVDSLLIDLDADGRPDRLRGSHNSAGCGFLWERNTGTGFAAASPAARVALPTVHWDQKLSGGSVVSDTSMNNENDCSLSGQFTRYANDSLNEQLECTSANLGGFLAYRFLDMDADGLPDLVTALSTDLGWYRANEDSDLKVSWGLQQCPSTIEQCTNIDEEAAEEAMNPDCGLEACEYDPEILDQVFTAGTAVACDELSGGFSGVLYQQTTDDEIHCTRRIRHPMKLCEMYPWKWKRNLGGGAFESTLRTTWSPVPLEPSTGQTIARAGYRSMSSAVHTIMDFDGDGRIDVATREGPAGNPGAGFWFLWRGDGQGNFVGRVAGKPYLWAVPHGAPFALNETGRVLHQAHVYKYFTGGLQATLDMNSDGLTDLVWNAPDGGDDPGAVTYFNTGTGFMVKAFGGVLPRLSERYINYSVIALDEGPGGDDGAIEDGDSNIIGLDRGTRTTATQLVDVDGDGRVEVFSSSQRETQLNIAYRYDTDGAGAQVAGIGGRSPDVQVTTGSSLEWQVERDVIDLNGDGQLDYAESTPTGIQYWTRPASRNALYRLRTIDNGVGGVTAIEYAASTDPAIDIPGTNDKKGMPQHLWVVKSMTTRNLHVGKWPSDPSTPAPVVGETSYLYGEPVWNQDPYGKWGFRGFKNVDVLGPEDAQQKRSKVSSQFYYSTDYSGRLLETVTYEDSTSDHPDSIRRTEHQALFMFDDGDRVIEPGEVRSVQEYVDQSFTCRAGQTHAECKDPLTRHLLQVYTTWNGFPTAGPTRVYVPTSIRKTRSDSEASLHDKQIYRKFHIVNTATDYRVRQTLEELRERNYNTQEEIVYQKHYQRTLLWDPQYRGHIGNREETTATNVVRTESFILDPVTGVMTAKKRFNQHALGAAGKLISFTHDVDQVHVASTTNELDQTVYTTYDLGTGKLLSTRGPNSYRPPGGGATQYEETKTTIDGFGRLREEWVAVDKAGGGYELKQTRGIFYEDGENPQRVLEARIIDFGSRATAVSETMYDGLGQVMKTVEWSQDGSPDEVSILRYDNRGNLVEVMAQDPSVNTQTPAVYTFAYDRLGRLEEATRPMVDGFQGGFTISRDGPVETRTEKARAKHPAATTRTTRDVFDRLTVVEELKDKDAPGAYATTGYEYDGFDNLVRVVSADGNTTALAYDFVSRRTSISRGGRTWRYEYDDNDNLIHEIAPHTSGTDEEYTTSIVYDDLDRPISRLAGVRALTSDQLAEIGHGPTVFTYDEGQNGKGRLTAVATPSSTVSFEYDARGQMVSQTRSFDLANELNLAPGSFGDTRTQTFSYNAAGQILSASHGDSAPGQAATQSTTAYDLRGLPAGLVVNRGGTTSTVATVVDRNVAGLLTTLASPLPTVGREATQKWSRDVLGRVLSHEVRQTNPDSGNALLIAEGMTHFDADDALLVAEAMTYLDTDDVAALLSERVGLAPRSFVFGYDDRHQLDFANDGEYIADFDFSDGGLLARANITAPAGAPQAISRDVLYDYASGATHDPEAVDRLINQADGTDFVKYAFDDSGNVTLREQASGAFAFLYDGDDQQRRAIAPDGDQELYYYDESGQRILAVTRAAGGAVTKARFWMGSLEVEYSGAGTPTKTLAHLSLGTPVARVENRTTLEYQFHGGLGHLLGAMPEVGPGVALSVAYQYGPFGEILAQAGSTTDHTRRFNGKEGDILSGLNYYGFRYYDPLSLQWTQADPLYRFRPELAYNEPRRLNLYGFTLQNPARFVDPDGRDPDFNMDVRIEQQMAKAGVAPPEGIPEVQAFVLALMPDAFDASIAAAGVVPFDGPLPAGEIAAGGIIGVRTIGKIPDAIRAAARVGDDVPVFGSKVADDAANLTPRAARREAMREAGIPTSQQPTAQRSVHTPEGRPAGRQYDYETPAPGGSTQRQSVQHSLTDKGHDPHWEAGPVKPAGQRDALGRPRLTNAKSKVNEKVGE